MYFCIVIELDRHIEVLLLNNDCVIVPGLGGFMAHHIAARYEENEHIFLPPLRTLGFNPQLKLNDSLLVQSYIEAYDLSYPEAMRRIEDEVDELKQHLENEGSYELNDIGELTVNEDGHYVFTPCEAGILTPELYGLGTFEMPQLSAKKALEVPTEETEKPVATVAKAPVAPVAEPVEVVNETLEDEDDDDKALVIKMSWIRNAVAVAAAVLVFFLMTTPVVNSDVNNVSMSNLNSSVLFPAIAKDSNVEKIDLKKANMEKQITKADTVKADTVKTTLNSEPAKDKTTFCLVLASYVSKKNAAALVEKLQAQGYQESEVYIRNNVVRVIYGNFDNLNDAYNKLNKIQRLKDFNDAWVMKLKAES